jgi:hypothetical protein
MKSVSIIMILFLFFTTLILSMIWIIDFQIQSDQFLLHSKQLHRTLSLECIHGGCTQVSIKQKINQSIMQRFTHHQSHSNQILVFNLEPFILKIQINLKLPSLVKPIILQYEKTMIQEDD